MRRARLRGDDDPSACGLRDVIAQRLRSLSGSVTSASFCTKARPLISLRRSALTVPYLLFDMQQDYPARGPEASFLW